MFWVERGMSLRDLVVYFDWDRMMQRDEGMGKRFGVEEMD